ncbi:MAG: hypothetical protein Q8O99_03805 [bacterium]|nr:hypothetical protein [bacterium]
MTAHKEDVTMKKNTMVFFLRNDDKNDISTLKKQKDERFRLLQKRYTDVIDYSTNAGSREHKGSKSAGEFFNEQVENFIQDKILNNDNPQYLRIFI